MMKRSILPLLLLGLIACSNAEETSPLRGDLNQDGHLTRSDIDALEGLIRSGADNTGDLNGDGVTNQDDLNILIDLVCRAGGGAMTANNQCCITNQDGSICCDLNLDGDFNGCEPPENSCTTDNQCDMLNCPAYCANGKCRCRHMCDDNEDCISLNCPAFCNTNGECECKIACTDNSECAFISKCQSVCDTTQNHCVCANDCLGAGERFEGDRAQHNCCPGLNPIQYSEYAHGGVCMEVDCECYVCADCGDNSCDTGENPCNCPQDCGECLPNDTKTHRCPDGTEVPWCTCDADRNWVCIISPENACNQTCHISDDCDSGYVCDPSNNQCVVDCRMVNCQPGTNCQICPEGTECDAHTGLCAQTCLGAGESFVDFDTEGKCCAGLVAIPEWLPDDTTGTCIGPNCPCHVCTPCGDNTCDTTLGENRCSCASDCVGSTSCNATSCTTVPGTYAVIGDCPNTHGLSAMYEVGQNNCSLDFYLVLETVLGSTGCIDNDIIYTSNGCQGTVRVSGVSRTMYFTCPLPNSNDTCSVMLDDLID